MDIFSQAVYYTADSTGLLMASPQRERWYLIYSALCIKRNNQTNYSVLPCVHNPYCQHSDALHFRKLPSSSTVPAWSLITVCSQSLSEKKRNSAELCLSLSLGWKPKGYTLVCTFNVFLSHGKINIEPFKKYYTIT